MSALAAAPYDVDARVKRMYDHLYANASVRTPAGISAEVGKLMRTAAYIEKGAGLFPAFTFSNELRRSIQRNDNQAIKKLAATVKSEFAEMNEQWNHYD